MRSRFAKIACAVGSALALVSGASVADAKTASSSSATQTTAVRGVPIPLAPVGCASGTFCIWSQTGFGGTKNSTSGTGGVWTGAGITILPRSGFNNSSAGNSGGLRLNGGGGSFCWAAGTGNNSFNLGGGTYNWKFAGC